MQTSSKIQPSPLNPTGATDEHLEAHAVQEAKQLLQMLEPLLANPQFQEFWQKFGEGVKAQRKILLDPATPMEKREIAAQVHHALNTWYEWPMRNRAAAIQRLQAEGVREQQRTQADPPAP